jgi:endonuclease/exonuclease/phosphatase family metal-dependent hydrolase
LRIHRTRRAAPLLALLAIVAVAPATADAAKKKAKPDVTVMSRNLYLGADIIKLASSQNLNEEMAQAQALHATVDQTNFPLRAKAFAAEVKKNKPDVIGLQEVARFYRGPDGVHDGVTNASTPLYDFLAILQKEIKAKGLSYKVVSEQNELDVEVPSNDGYDLRLKLGNAVLVKKGKGATVKVKKGLKGIFTDQLTVPLPSGGVTLSRGWAGMDGTVAGKKFRFIDPHAEAYSDDIATKQFKELLKTGAKSKKVTTIMAGDFNSDPTAQGAKAGGYNAVVGAGFKDTSGRQNTCCQSETLTNNPSTLSQWIDHIVVRPKAKVLKRVVVGNKVSDMISGLWPSDHAGLVAKLRLKK